MWFKKEEREYRATRQSKQQYNNGDQVYQQRAVLALTPLAGSVHCSATNHGATRADVAALMILDEINQDKIAIAVGKCRYNNLVRERCAAQVEQLHHKFVDCVSGRGVQGMLITTRAIVRIGTGNRVDGETTTFQVYQISDDGIPFQIEDLPANTHPIAV